MTNGLLPAPVIGDRVTDASDAELVTHAVHGDRTAFGMLYLRHHEAAWRIAGVASGFNDDAEVAVIDGFTAVFSALPPGPAMDAFRRHLMISVRRIALDRVLPRSFPGRPFEPPASHAPVSDQQLLREGLRVLPEVHRAALWLTEVEAWTPNEVANALGLDASAVPVMLTGARDALRHHCRQASLRRGARIYDPFARPGPGLIAALDPVPPLGGECQRRWLRERAMHAALAATGRPG